MALQLFTLSGVVEIQTRGGEKSLRDVDSAAKKTTKSVTEAGDAAEKSGQKFDKSAGRLRDASGSFAVGGYVNEGPAYIPAPVASRYDDPRAARRGEGGRPVVNVNLKPDAQGRVRSRSQVSVEILDESDGARRNR